MNLTPGQIAKIRWAIESRKAKKASGAKIPRKNKKPIKPANIKIQERNFYRKLLKNVYNPAIEVVDKMLKENLESIVEEGKKELRIDSVGDTISNLINGIKLSYERQVQPKDFDALAVELGRDIEDFNKRQENRVFKSILGVDPFRNELYLEPLMDQFTKDNVNLIKTIPNDYFAQIERIVRGGVRSGKSAAQIGREIKAKAPTTKKRAAFIARDQTAKFNSDLARQRQKEVGLNYYIWRTVKDRRVRPEDGGGTTLAAQTQRMLKEGKSLEQIAKKNAASRPSGKGGNHRRLEGGLFSWDNPPYVDSKSLRSYLLLRLSWSIFLLNNCIQEL